MSRFDDLIQELCPNGVSFKSIGEIGRCFAGATPKSGVASYWENGTIPWMSSGEVNKRTIWGTEKKISQLGYDSCSTKMVPSGAVVIALAGQGKTRGLVARTRMALCTNQSLCAIVTNEAVISDFLYYFLTTQYRQLRSLSSGDSTRGGLNLQMIRSYKIPVPPVELQREVVRVLDTFTSLQVELEAELEARQRQYDYYRRNLLTFPEDGPQWATLGEVCTKVSSGGTPLSSRADYYGGDIPWLRTQEVRFVDVWDTEMRITEKAVKETSAKWIPANCVIVAISGATAGRSAVNKISLTTNQHCCNFEVDPARANYRYVFYWVRSQYEQIKALGQGARSDLNAGIIKNVKIPVPPLDEQERIVAILDKFDALVNDLSVGLPAELVARRKQYEYYRDRHMTFEETVA